MICFSPTRHQFRKTNEYRHPIALRHDKRTLIFCSTAHLLFFASSFNSKRPSFDLASSDDSTKTRIEPSRWDRWRINDEVFHSNRNTDAIEASQRFAGLNFTSTTKDSNAWYDRIHVTYLIFSCWMHEAQESSRLTLQSVTCILATNSLFHNNKKTW